MNRNSLFITNSSLLLLPLVFLHLSVYAADRDLPPGEPPPKNLHCSPTPPSTVRTELTTISEDGCLTFSELFNKYRKKERHKKPNIKNRSIIFYHIFNKFVEEKKGEYNSPYRFNISTMRRYFGNPDHVKALSIETGNTKYYAYLFNYHSDKDYSIIMSEKNNKITSVVYGETKLTISNDWDAFQISTTRP